MNKVKMEDERVAIFERDNYRCQNCQKSVFSKGTPQLAHRIANTVANRKKYGDCVIDHPLNRVATCTLYCNGKMNIGNKPREAEELADKIRDALLEE